MKIDLNQGDYPQNKLEYTGRKEAT